MNIVKKVKSEIYSEDRLIFGWHPEFKKTKSIFIHIPKTAGTSVFRALYGSTIHHHTIKEYERLSHRRLNAYFKFSFVRHPVDRLISTYFYSFDQIKRNQNTSVAFITKYNSIDKFIIDWLTPENVRQHYFLKPQCSYLYNSSGELGVDFIGRFETIGEDFQFIAQKLGLKIDLPIANTSTQRKKNEEISDKSLRIIKDVYADDFQLFSY